MGKEERLKSRKLIDRVFREGKSFALFPFRVYYAPLPPRGAAGAASPGIAAAGTPGAIAAASSTEAAATRGATAIAPIAGTQGAAAAPTAEPLATTDVLAGASRKTPAAPALRLQAGFGASSRNFKKAVDRNRIKRLTREAYRLQKHTLQAWLREKDRSLALFFIYTGKELPDYEVVKEKIGLALQKLMKEPGS